MPGFASLTWRRPAAAADWAGSGASVVVERLAVRRGIVRPRDRGRVALIIGAAGPCRREGRHACSPTPATVPSGTRPGRELHAAPRPALALATERHLRLHPLQPAGPALRGALRGGRDDRGRGGRGGRDAPARHHLLARPAGRERDP